MGCAYSKVEREEPVRRSKDRKRLMKQLVIRRSDLAAAHLAYLQSLRNAGATLRQFMDDDSAVPAAGIPPSPLPPPPPPPPPFSGKDGWDYWDPFEDPRSSKSSKKEGEGEDVDENWAETKTEFDEEEETKVAAAGMDDSSSAVSWFTKESDVPGVVVWREKNSMAGIVRELDDYFLKASAGGTEVVALLESNRNGFLRQNFAMTEKCNKSAKVFSSLSWRWSSRSPLSTRDAIELHAAEVCRSVSHCMTLDKLFAEEQKLYNEVKQEELAKMKHRKKSLLLQRQESREEEWTKTEKTRANIHELQSRIRSIEDSISRTCLAISKLRDEELHPQLNRLCSGLMQMWRTMYECHQVQNHIAQQASHLHNHPTTEPTSNSHRHARFQLETELTSWHNTFHKLINAQREYFHTLNQWVRLTDCLPDSNELFGNSSGIYSLCEEWQLALERLPEKVASEAIKSFISVIYSIGLQLKEEHNLQKKSERMERRLEKEIHSLGEIEKKHSGDSDSVVEIAADASNSKPVSAKYTKLNVLKKKAEDEKAKYLNSIGVSRAMTLNNLQTSLPNVFQAMMGFSGMCVQAFESIQQRHTGTSIPAHVDCPSPPL